MSGFTITSRSLQQWPEAAERGPEEAIQRVQYGARPFTLQHGDLLAKGEDLQRRIAATAEEDSKHREHGEDEFEHGSIPCNTA